MAGYPGLVSDNRVGVVSAKISAKATIIAALITGVIAICLYLAKSDTNTVKQECSGSECVQIGKNSGTINFNAKKKKATDIGEK